MKEGQDTTVRGGVSLFCANLKVVSRSLSLNGGHSRLRGRRGQSGRRSFFRGEELEIYFLKVESCFWVVSGQVQSRSGGRGNGLPLSAEACVAA